MSEKNGAAVSDDAAEAHAPDEETLKKLGQLRAQVRENFGKITMAMMALPRYRHQSIADLQQLVLDPMLRDRVAVAYPGDSDPRIADIAGLAIWASVSDEVDAKIREQIKAGVFPLRLKPEDWNSGKTNWLFDVIAPDAPSATRVLANFRQVVKEGDLRLHPLLRRIIDRETLEKMAGPRPEEEEQE